MCDTFESGTSVHAAEAPNDSEDSEIVLRQSPNNNEEPDTEFPTRYWRNTEYDEPMSLWPWAETFTDDDTPFPDLSSIVSDSGTESTDHESDLLSGEQTVNFERHPSYSWLCESTPAEQSPAMSANRSSNDITQAVTEAQGLGTPWPQDTFSRFRPAPDSTDITIEHPLFDQWELVFRTQTEECLE